MCSEINFNNSRHNLTFFEIEKVDENGEYSLVYRSDNQKRGASEIFWPRFVMPVRMFCGNDLDRAIRFKFFNCNRTGSSRLIGKKIKIFLTDSEGRIFRSNVRYAY